jgi:hypothetical protein
MVDWTAGKVAEYSVGEIKSLRENALKQGAREVVELCDAELSRRKPTRVKRVETEITEVSRARQYVSEFHFVCPSELGVARNQDGSIWTGVWVVA